MAFQVIISPEASENLDQIMVYLESSWSEKVCGEFIQGYRAKLELLSQMPLMYSQVDGYDDIRRCILTKQSLMFYQVDEAREVVNILSIVDARSNPEDFPY